MSAPNNAVQADVIRLLVGFSKVSASNIVAEIIRPALSITLGQPVTSVTLPGENGARAAEHTAQAAPDGHTLCIAVPTHIMGAWFDEKPRYDLLRDFAAVAMIAKNPLVLGLWGLFIAVALALGTLPFFIGLALVIPVLGHASWHLYRKVVV